MNKILITGGTGFLGRHLLEFYQDKEYEIYFTGRNLEIGLFLEKEKLGTFINLDLSNKIDNIILNSNKFDFVIHCASLSSPWGNYEDFYKNNVVATENIINFAIKNNVKRFIHVSTPSIYFEGKDSLKIKESEIPNKQINHYAQTKRIAEDIILSKKDKIEVIGIRPRGIFGEYDTSIIPRVLKIAENGKVPLINKGRAVIDITYVGNVVHAINLCISAKKEALNYFYNITNDSPKSVKYIMDSLFDSINKKVEYRNINYNLLLNISNFLEFWGKITKKEPKITKYGVGLIGKSQTLDIEKAKNKLNYSAIYSIEEGIKKYAKWRKNNGC